MEETVYSQNGMATPIWEQFSTTPFITEATPLPPTYNQSAADTISDVTKIKPYESISPALDRLIGDIRKTTDRLNKTNYISTSSTSSGSGGPRISGAMSFQEILNTYMPRDTRINNTEMVPLSQTHEVLSDGVTWIPKYDVYKHGIDNDAYNESMQGTAERWLNPVKRFASKTSHGVLDLAATVYGIGAAVANANADMLFDNSFSKYIDDLDKRTDFQYKNYYTKAQEAEGLGFNLNTVDKVLGGAEFTARMLVQDALLATMTGGTSLAGTLSRRALQATRLVDKANDVATIGGVMSKVLKGVNKPLVEAAKTGASTYTSMATNAAQVSAINKAGQIADLLKLGKFAVLGSNQEAAMETRMFKKEAETDFWNYHREKGTEPSNEEVTDFYKTLDSEAWKVYGTNMAVLTSSNLAMFSKTLGLNRVLGGLSKSTGVSKVGEALSGVTKAIDKKVLGIGTELVEDTYKAVKPNFLQKIAGYATPLLKGAVTEGVYEEGMQGVASNMVKNYMNASYNPSAARETANYTDAFTQALVKQYTTKEGLEEVIIGGITGGIFGGAFGGISNTKQAYKKQTLIAEMQNAEPGFAQDFYKNRAASYAQETLNATLAHANRSQYSQQQAAKAAEQGNTIKSELHGQEQFISMYQRNRSLGREGEFMEVMKANLEGLSAEQIAEQQNISVEEAKKFKQQELSNLEEFSTKEEKLRKAASYIFDDMSTLAVGEQQGKVNPRAVQQNMIDAFVYAGLMSQTAEKIAGDRYSQLQDTLAQSTTSIALLDKVASLVALDIAGNEQHKQFVTEGQKADELKKQEQELSDKIISLESRQQTEEDRLERQQLATDLNNIGTLRSQAEQKRNLLWKALSENFFKKLGKQGVLPMVELTNFEQNIQDIEELMLQELTSPEIKQEVTQLLNEFTEAADYHKQFNNILDKMSNKKVDMRFYSGFFSGRRAKNKTINDATADLFHSLYGVRQSDSSDIIKKYQPLGNPITPELLEAIKAEKGNLTVTDDIKKWFHKKITDKTQLSELEQEVYDNYKEEIDAYIEEINNPISATIDTVIEDSTVKKIRLEQDIIALQDQLDSLETADELMALKAQLKQKKDEYRTLTQVVKEDDRFKEVQNLQSEIETLEKELFEENFYNEIDNPKLSGRPRRGRIKNKEKYLEIVNKKLELERLKGEQPTEYPLDGTVNEQIDWIVSNIHTLDFNNEESELVNPSAEDIQEYRELVANPNLSKKSQTRLEELRASLSAFKLAEGVKFDGLTLPEILAIQKQVQAFKEKSEVTEPENPNTKIEETIKKHTSMESAFSSSNVGLVFDIAVISKDSIHHIKLESMLQKSLDAGFNPTIIDETTEEEVTVTQDNLEEVGTKYDSQRGIRVVLTPDIVIRKPQKSRNFKIDGEVENFTNLMGLYPYVIGGQTNRYVVLFEQKSDGTLAMKESEFKLTTKGVETPFDKDTNLSIQPGDELTLTFNPQDDYNQTLTPDEWVDKGVIYVKKGTKIVQILKATDVKQETEEWKHLKAWRVAVIHNFNSKKKTLRIKAKEVFTPFPNITIDSTTMQPVQHKVQTDDVVSYGYIKGGKVTYFDKVDQSDETYVEPYMGKTTVTPVMAFQHNGKTYTIPMTLKPNGIDATKEFDDIQNNIWMSKSAKIIATNELLRQYGLESQELAWTSSNDTRDVIRDTLKNVIDTVDPTDLSAVQSAEKTTIINTKTPFTFSKIKFDMAEKANTVVPINKSPKKPKQKPSEEGAKAAEENSCSK